MDNSLVTVFRICYITDYLNLSDIISLSYTSKNLYQFLLTEITTRKDFIYNTYNFCDTGPYGICKSTCNNTYSYKGFQMDYIPYNNEDDNNDLINYSIRIQEPCIYTIVSCDTMDEITFVFDNMNTAKIWPFEIFNIEGDIWVKVTFDNKGELVFLSGEEYRYMGMSRYDTQTLDPKGERWKQYLGQINRTPILELFGNRLQDIHYLNKSFKYSMNE